MKNPHGLRKAYHRLCTEFYDISKPFACPGEVFFYADVLKGVQGPILEAMCGSGRLLVPLLRLGFEIDGLDNSAEMLESCKKRCLSENLKVSLFNQQIESSSLKKYALIFIAVGSFQLITDRAEALKVLRILHSHLQPDGSLILDTFIPWDSIKESIEGASLSKEKKTVSSNRFVTCPDGAEIFLKSMTIIDPWEQLETSKNQYEKRLNGKVIAHEEEDLAIRWYYPREMELFLEKAGFSRVLMTEHTFEHNPNSIVYQAMV
ncbi:MAG: class I SAM-dependent methyltransferase [Chlamydiales bacterium]|nr:class I SAM-dependent methyltransferase [Chlamydiales bacterium]